MSEKLVKSSDAELFDELGIKSENHRRILLEALPCGIETAVEAYEDKTSLDINGPRVILICFWKGMVMAFRRLEAGR